jgi:hypothetical protein
MEKSMRRLIVLLLLPLALSAQLSDEVILKFTPETDTVFTDIKPGLVPWDAMICSNSTAPLTIAPERILMASPELQAIAPARVRNLLEHAKATNWKSQVVQYVALGGTVAVAVTGFGAVATSVTTVASIGLGTDIAFIWSNKLKGELPNLAPFLDNMLEEPISLAPGMCATRTVFTSKMAVKSMSAGSRRKGPQPLTASMSRSSSGALTARPATK